MGDLDYQIVTRNENLIMAEVKFKTKPALWSPGLYDALHIVVNTMSLGINWPWISTWLVIPWLIVGDINALFIREIYKETRDSCQKMQDGLHGIS